jgi:hypothetical protein
MKLSLMGSALVATLLSTAAFAQDETRVGITAATENQAGLDVESYGLVFDGDNGAFNYGLTLQTGDVEGIDYDASSADLTWTGIGKSEALMFGPTISYSAADLEGFDSVDATFAGVAVQSKMDNFRVKADITGDIDDFETNWATSVEADYYMSPRATLEGDYAYLEMDDTPTHSLRLGGRYNVTTKTYAEAGALLNSVDGDQGTGAYVGAGFRF